MKSLCKPCLEALRSTLRISRRSYATNRHGAFAKHLAHVKELSKEDVTPKLPSGDQLPLPPFLDTKRLRSVQRLQSPKPAPNPQNRTAFQEKLYANPYAHILASPVRHCRHTHIRIPTPLLTSFAPTQKPSTGDFWVLPLSLADALPKTPGTRRPQTSYVGQTAKMIDTLGRKETWKYAAITPVEMKRLPRDAKTVWRDDMSDYIGNLLRDVVRKRLRTVVPYKANGGVVELPNDLDELESGEEEEGQGDLACVLFLHPVKSEALAKVEEEWKRLRDQADSVAREIVRLVTQSHAQLQLPPLPQWAHDRGVKEYLHAGVDGRVVPRLPKALVEERKSYQMLEWKGKRVPCYDLHSLLGEERLEKAFRWTWLEDAWREGRWIGIRHHHRAKGTLEALLQLAMYV